MISGFFLLAFVVTAGAILKSAWLKGVIGEYRVNSLIESRLEKTYYRIFKDVLLPTENGTTQIDHIIISKFGIFVIETKNMSNWIFANTGQCWTQVKFKAKYKFQNPLRQNYKHVKTLENLLKGTEEKIFNIVVFDGDCEFKTDVPMGVVKLNNLIFRIKSYQTQLFEEDDLNEYVKKIEKTKLKNTIINRIKHIQHVDNIRISKGYHSGLLEGILEKYIYKILLLFAFFLILLSTMGKNSERSAKTPSIIMQNNIEQQNKMMQKQHSSQPKKIQSKDSEHYLPIQTQTISKNENKKQVIYSWKEPSGYRGYSNNGFPKDKPYSDPTIQFY